MNKNMNWLMIILLMMKTVLNECGKNCSICDSLNICLFCDVSSLYLLKGQTCVYSNIDFCERLTINGICLGCKKNYY